VPYDNNPSNASDNGPASARCFAVGGKEYTHTSITRTPRKHRHHRTSRRHHRHNRRRATRRRSARPSQRQSPREPSPPEAGHPRTSQHHQPPSPLAGHATTSRAPDGHHRHPAPRLDRHQLVATDNERLRPPAVGCSRHGAITRINDSNKGVLGPPTVAFTDVDPQYALTGRARQKVSHQRRHPAYSRGRDKRRRGRLLYGGPPGGLQPGRRGRSTVAARRPVSSSRRRSTE